MMMTTKTLRTYRESKYVSTGFTINTYVGHFGGESFQSIALVPTAKHRKTREYTHHRKKTKKKNWPQ